MHGEKLQKKKILRKQNCNLYLPIITKVMELHMQIRFSPFFTLLCDCSPCILLIHKLCIFEKTWEVEVVKSFQSLNLLTFHREALEEGAVLTIQCITLSNR